MAAEGFVLLVSQKKFDFTDEGGSPLFGRASLYDDAPKRQVYICGRYRAQPHQL